MTITNNASLIPYLFLDILLQLTRRVSGRRLEKKREKERTKNKKKTVAFTVQTFILF